MNKPFLDINTHEFTLHTLSELLDAQAKLEKKIRKVKAANGFRTIVLLVVLYYVYDNLTQKINELKEESK